MQAVQHVWKMFYSERYKSKRTEVIICLILYIHDVYTAFNWTMIYSCSVKTNEPLSRRDIPIDDLG